ncbi:MAG: alpha-amylase family glycosyl hydrolase [Candidatus Saccharimonadales bacterium]
MRTPQLFISHHKDWRWPEGAIVYQIYPRSLQDSNNDGVGDLPGITSRLGYLQDLGINAIWLSPFYLSPMIDFGYDVSDHKAVDPIFGTLADFKAMLKEAHSRDIRVMIDLVPNHTSDEHVWFKESRSSRNNPKANWYIWKDPHPDSEPGRQLAPNNWRDALSGESAWQWVPERGQFYLHSFDRRQPDLNWTSPAVREAIKDVMRFWLDMGVDGFRVDAGDWLAKDPLFRDDDRNPEFVSGEDRRYEALAHNNSRGWPTLYAHLSEIAGVLKEASYAKHPRFMVTEAYPPRHNPLASYVAFYEAIDPLVAAPFNFEGIFLPWKAGDWRRFLRAFHKALDDLGSKGVASYAYGNHDRIRLASRLGEASARSVAIMQMTLPGLVFVYYGEELGMQNVPIPAPFIRDPQARDDPHYSRDPERTPMQWNDDINAGFSKAKTTWLPVGEDYKTRNVEAEKKDPHSFYNLYRTLARLRNQSPALQHGQLQVLELGHPDLLGYVRSEKDEFYIVLINFSNKPVTAVPGVKLRRLLVSSHAQTKLADGIDGKVELLPHEGALFLQ